MFIDPLEPRRLAAVHQGHATLYVAGTPGPDHIVVTAVYNHGFKLQVTLNNRPTKQYNAYAYSRIKIDGGAGNDYLESDLGNPGVYLIPAMSTEILGGNGNDTLVGSSFSDTLGGGAGNDILIGNAGDDSLVGGAGNDLVSGGAGQDFFQGGDGEILIDYTRLAPDYDSLRSAVKARLLSATLHITSTGYTLTPTIAHLPPITLDVRTNHLTSIAASIPDRAHVAVGGILTATTLPDGTTALTLTATSLVQITSSSR